MTSLTHYVIVMLLFWGRALPCSWEAPWVLLLAESRGLATLGLQHCRFQDTFLAPVAPAAAIPLKPPQLIQFF